LGPSQVWKIQNDWSRILQAPIDNQTQLAGLAGNLIPHFAQARLSGKPFLITEWNDCFPNEYRLEGPPLLAAYADLQGWDGALQFDFDHAVPGVDGLQAFELSRWPDELAQWVAAAPLFHRRDVKEAPGEVVERVGEDAVLSLPSYSDFLVKNPWLPFVTRVSRKIMDPKPGVDGSLKAFKSHYDAAAQSVTSETGELALNSKERFSGSNRLVSKGAWGPGTDGRSNFPPLRSN